MGFFDKAKKEHDYSREEIEKKMENAVIPEHAKRKTDLVIIQKPVKKPRTKPQRRPVIVIPSEKNVFFVESSFKLPPTFILNGYSRSGSIMRNMKANVNGETILIESIQSSFKRVGKLVEGQKGSLEIKANIGLEVPDFSELEFSFKTKKGKRKKRKKTKAKKTGKKIKKRESVRVQEQKEMPVEEPQINAEEIAESLMREGKGEPVIPVQ